MWYRQNLDGIEDDYLFMDEVKNDKFINVEKSNAFLMLSDVKHY